MTHLRIEDYLAADKQIERAHRLAAAESDVERDSIQSEPARPALPFTLLDGPAIAGALQPLEYLCRELALVAGAGAPHLVAGFGFSGKTLAMQALELDLAAGLPILGAFRRREPCRVVHVDLEQGERLTRLRFQRLARARNVDLPALGDTLALVAMPRISLIAAHRNHWHTLMTGRDLIVIDSLRAATAGLDENSSDIRAPLDLLGSISEATGCRALVIHHARKPSVDAPAGGRYSIRGSGAIYDACDSVYVFAAQKGEPIAVECEKARSHGELVEGASLVIEDVALDDDPKAGVSVAVRGAELIAEVRTRRARLDAAAAARHDAEAILAVVRARPGLGRMDLVAAAHINSKRVGAALLELGAAVTRKPEKEGRGWVVRHYIATPSESES